jgi:stage II sporulation protein D
LNKYFLAVTLLFAAAFSAGHFPLPGAAADGRVTVSVFSRLHPRSVRVMAAKGMIVCSVGSERNTGQDVRITWQSPRRLSCRWLEAKPARAERVLIQPEIPGTALRVEVPNFPAREFRGTFAVSGGDNALLLLNRLPLEDYLYGVIGSEMAANGEALKCQALVSRTYALGNLGRHRKQGHDFCDTTHCQYYRGRSGETGEIRAAVDQTKGMALFFGGKPAKVYCHSTCGGVTNAADAAWGGKKYPYLTPVDDHGACRVSPHFRWQCRISAGELLVILSESAGHALAGWRIEEPAPGGWVKSMILSGAGGGERRVSGEWFHLALGRKLGWNTFKSGNFTVEKSGEGWLFSGRGLGHGVGLCQYGAMQMAEQGRGFQQIALFYFPGTEIIKTSDR